MKRWSLYVGLAGFEVAKRYFSHYVIIFNFIPPISALMGRCRLVNSNRECNTSKLKRQYKIPLPLYLIIAEFLLRYP